MPLSPAVRDRLKGFLAAIRFAWIPVLCAAFILVASDEPHGRRVALAAAAMALGAGLALHADAVVRGRADESLLSSGDTDEMRHEW